jgi:hypothetical protein
MSTMLEHLEPEKVPSMTHMPPCCTTAPTVQAIVVDSVPIVDPELASVIRYYPEDVSVRTVNPRATCPTNSEVITSAKAWPAATSVAIHYIVTPTLHVWFSTV